MFHFLLAFGIFGIDQYCKHKVEEPRKYRDRKLLGGAVTLTRHHNEGIVGNKLEKKPLLVLVLNSIVFGILLAWWWEQRQAGKEKNSQDSVRCIPSQIGLSLLVGGAASNLWDRFKRGYVVDYFCLNGLPFASGHTKARKQGKMVYNLGDMAIFTGGLFTLFGTVIKN